MSEDKLESFLKSGPDWGRLKTSIPGIFVLKMPAYRSSPARLAVELNPVDASGTPTKKRGLVLRSKNELEQYRGLFQYEKLLPLLEGVEKFSPPVKKSATLRQTEEEVLEI
jgi:hypothetical protein